LYGKNGLFFISHNKIPLKNRSRNNHFTFRPYSTPMMLVFYRHLGHNSCRYYYQYNTEMKKLVLWVVALSCTIQIHAQTKTPADYVDPFIGGSTSAAKAGVLHGLGKTFPGAATPFGLVQVSPNTITGGDNGPGYSYEMEYMEGFAFTQMSGIGWYGDLGNLLTTPTTGPLHVVAGRHKELPGYRSRYSKTDEIAKAGYYAASLTDYNVRAEVTAAPHSGIMRFTFPQNKQSRIQIDLARRVGGTSTEQFVQVVDDYTIQGWMKCTPEGGGWGNGDGKANYTVYFYAQFSKPLKNYGVWSAEIPDGISRKSESVTSLKYDSLINKAVIIPNIESKQGKHLGFYTEFATSDKEVVLMKAGISFSSLAGARLNLTTEIPAWDFTKTRMQAKAMWNKSLSQISVAGGTEAQKTVFYTALYHTMIDPRATSDVDGTYMGADMKPHKTNKCRSKRQPLFRTLGAVKCLLGVHGGQPRVTCHYRRLQQGYQKLRPAKSLSLCTQHGREIWQFTRRP
jgi:predicted alpha-1,2-mannosidase